MPALSYRCAVDTPERSGQASDKPRGRKPRDALALLGAMGIWVFATVF